jgi:hypothetical protein
VSRFVSRAWPLALALALTTLVTACELDTVAIDRTTPSIVVHGVLNPSAANQVVLLERTLTGRVNIPDTSFDSSDPIISAGGIAVVGALAEITDPSGRVFRGVEDRTVNANGKGAGVYRFAIGGSALQLGGRYQLRVVATTGEEVRAATRIPGPTPRVAGGLTRTFNRDRDAILTQWSRVPAARSYAVRIESPFGPFFLFTDSTSFRMTGELRNLFAGDLQRVFVPGFRQDMIVAAVDSNFYDYYRTSNDPFTGSGIISRVEGGLGMFGSIVSLNTGTISVIADQNERIEGRFRLMPTTSDASTPTLLTLYVESKPAKPDLPTAITGRYTLGSSTTRGDGIIGQLLGTTVSLGLIANQLAHDTVDVIDAELTGDTLRGSYRKRGGNVVFVRVP